MSFFKNLFGKEKKQAEQVVTPVQANNKGTSKTVDAVKNNVIDMSKSKENLNKVLINMSKDSKIDMSKHKARVAMAIDYSGSMDWLYNNGSVQKTISRLLPIALKFDDNGELESWLFSNGCKSLEAVTEKNYNNYVKKVIGHSGMCMGGTSYSPVLQNIVHHYKDKEPSTTPAFVIFITDGENSDASATDTIVRELSEYNMFVQFVGIGDSSFRYLEKLDELSGRNHDNTGFVKVSDLNELSDEELYKKLLEQYNTWLKNK